MKEWYDLKERSNNNTRANRRRYLFLIQLTCHSSLLEGYIAQLPDYKGATRNALTRAATIAIQNRGITTKTTSCLLCSTVQFVVSIPTALTKKPPWTIILHQNFIPVHSSTKKIKPFFNNQTFFFLKFLLLQFNFWKCFKTSRNKVT